ncbi:MAG: 3-phosphoshikimate 1-carboxyvinyltransferase [Nevskiaceae bacterium]|nr:MAG: 3-phosphoshikimate 1-carboxyvinyltransferase [Nevskiaceae bacterium]TBR74778.1 MAG: 3-phosphoshikimate 1-carboxyvinyltransferase [Nevskiaceae bacterium]
MSTPGLSFIVQPGGSLCGRIRVPGDKSISHRSVIFGALANGTTEVRGFLNGADCLATIDAFRAMGVKVEHPEPTVLRIHGVGLHGLKAPAQALDVGNSGTSMRLMAGLLAGQGFAATLCGDASLTRRPMKRIVDPLTQMGARLETSTAGTAPLHIQPATGLHGIDYIMPVSSAQVKSCLLLAGLYAGGTTTVHDPGASRDHTERMLRAFGVTVTVDGACVSLQGGQALHAARVDIPADISSAAFFMVAAAIAPGSDLTLETVGTNPTRIGIVEILRRMGADIELLNARRLGDEPVADIRIRGSRPLHGADIGADLVTLAIDEIPALFVAAACAEGTTRISGAHELRVKESDRIATMAAGLGAMGAELQEQPDGAVITGGALHGAHVQAYSDHRIAMSLAMAALRSVGEIRIDDCDNVRTSFPGFCALAQSVGLSIHEITSTID